MQRVEDPQEFQRALEEARRSGRTIGLVPTMGALHEGHESLIRTSRDQCVATAVTIFVNPLQFAAGEDLERYPRTLAMDLERCEKFGVEFVFTPTQQAMYPHGFQTSVLVNELTQPLEGQHRPGHFSGVTTVVAKLFALSGACTAFFGRKDYQQWKVIERMTRDLSLPVNVVGCAIVREPDGLAMSSRNRYLNPAERTRALGIVQGLRAANDAWKQGERNPETLAKFALQPLETTFDRIDYVAAVDPDNLLPVDRKPERILIAVAAHLGATRLIDNLVLGEEPRP